MTKEKDKQEIKKVTKKKKEKVLDKKKIIKNKKEKVTNEKSKIDKFSLLSKRDQFNIRVQLVTCYKIILNSRTLKKEDNVRILFSVDKNGVILKESIQVIENEDSKIKNIKSLKESILSCGPLRNFPSNQYEVWKEVDLTFGKAKLPK